MTNQTDPRVEAAARAMCRRESGYLYSTDRQLWENVSWGRYKERAADALKAADKAAWLPIETAPNNTVIMIGWPNRTSNAAILIAYEWRFPGGDVMHGGKFATHWRPLPTPPETP